MDIGIIFPVYNEENRLKAGIEKTEDFIRNRKKCVYHIYIIDNGSNDKTWEIAKQLKKKYDNLTICRIQTKGVGAAVRKGVEISKESIVGYMDIDLSTDIFYLKKVEKILGGEYGYEIVNASRLSGKSKTKGRKWYRNISSYGLTILLKAVFKMRASDAVCGFKFFKRNTIRELMCSASDENGWLYIIELLLIAERENRKIFELPVIWVDEINHSQVNVPRQILAYIKGIVELKKRWK